MSTPLNPNKSSGDIVERWTPEQFLEYLATILHEWQVVKIPLVLSAHGLQIVPAAEIERLRREVENLQRALLFWMPGADLRLDGATFERVEEDAGLLAGYTGGFDGTCWGDEMLDRALTAESAVAGAWEEAAKIAEDFATFRAIPEKSDNTSLAMAIASISNEACKGVASAIRAAGEAPAK